MATRQPNPPEDDTNAEQDEQAEQARNSSRQTQAAGDEDAPGTEANSPVIINK